MQALNADRPAVNVGPTEDAHDNSSPRRDPSRIILLFNLAPVFISFNTCL